MWLNVLKLKLSLQVAGFDAHFHAYDWRLPLGELAQQLEARLAAEPSRRFMLVGHSMGGLVARAALAGPSARRILRVVQVGSPNGGSFAPVLALRGLYPTVRKLAALDRRHSAEDLARIVFRTLPSLHELLPSPARWNGLDLFDAANWPDDPLRPEQSRLSLAAGVLDGLPPADERCLQLIGVRQDTITGLHRERQSFEFAVNNDGDGTVPRPLALWAGARAWFVAEGHGALPNNGRVIRAIVDLLRTGETRALARSPRGAHGERPRSTRGLSEATLRRIAPHKVELDRLSPDARRRILEPVVSPEFHADATPGSVGAPPLRHRRVRTLDLRLVPESIVEVRADVLVLGVFRGVDPSGAADAIDERLGGAIRLLSQRRQIDGTLGRVEQVSAANTPLHAASVVLVGLGDFDRFDAGAVQHAAAAAARVMAATQARHVAAVTFGAGSGLGARAAITAQLQGFAAGLSAADSGGQVRRLTICEINARRHAQLARALRGIVAFQPTDLEGLRLSLRLLEARPAARRARDLPRPSAVEPDPVYLLANAVRSDDEHLTLRVSILTAGARAAVLSGTQTVRRRELAQLLLRIESRQVPARGLARTGNRLARLLLPTEVHAGLAATRGRALVVVHDRECARFPWETLCIDDRFPALEAGLSRRYAGDGLTAARWAVHREVGAPLGALVASDPTGDLPGAASEQRALQAMLQAHSAALLVRWLEGARATRSALLQALRSGSLDLLHFAGHAFFEPDAPERSGLVCAEGKVLRGSDLAGIAELPALVFCNACEAGRVRRAPQSRTTGLAEAFLDGGVANFLGTHWPVDDASALAFSTGLYRRLLAGDALGTAVLLARRAVLDRGSADWANYIHYGNASFRFRP